LGIHAQSSFFLADVLSILKWAICSACKLCARNTRQKSFPQRMWLGCTTRYLRSI